MQHPKHHWIRPFSRAAIAIGLAIAPNALYAENTKEQETIDFNRDIRPILSNNCYYCHGPDVKNNKADLRLDIRAEAIAAYAIAPGEPESSDLVERIFSKDSSEVMPPPEAHKSLSPEQKEKLVKWIREGAEYDSHWSYKRVERPEAGSIDEIVESNLGKKKLKLSQEASRETLLRRLYLDTIGLPPTPQQIENYLSDQSPDAYERLVDELLASPHFGENMAASWLDAVRYADTLGYHGDQTRDASPFRDYVIHAFNTNKPYDQFTIEQIAGDLLPNATLEQRVASSFNRLNQSSQEGGIQDKEYLKKYQAERVRTTSTTFLGSTLACAECHDHKFDPFTAKDFYSFAAFFSDILERGAYNNSGSFQEEDLSKFLKDPAVKIDTKFGTSLRVPNRTFLQDSDELEAELAERWNVLRHGTKAAEVEFQKWLSEKRQAYDSKLPAEYPLPSFGKHRGLRIAKGQLPAENGYRFSLEIFPGEPDSSKNGAAVEFTFPDARYVFFWGKSPKKESDQRILINKGAMPKAREWSTLTIDLRELKKHRHAEVSEVTFIENAHAKDAKPTQIRNFKLQTTLHAVPIGNLSNEAIRLLRQCINHPSDTRSMSGLREIFFTTHAGSPDQIALRENHQLLAEFIHGTRETPVTISATPREIRILPRGNWMDESGEIVLPATPEFLDFSITSDSSRRLNRLDLARWIVNRDNPLAARTYVNRLWADFFGTPLSSAPEDLGLQGEYPVYPELMDWLAAEFMESGWDIKHLIKTILMSKTYRQTSRSTPELDLIDPHNRLLARQTPRRLKAENIRDNVLSASGLLVRRIGGASSTPYQPAGYYRQLNFPKRTYQEDHNENQYRRGLYTHWQRTFLHPMLMAFDAPSRDECAVSRPVSNTPMQALNLLNDPTFVEAARALADQVLTASADDSSRIESLYLRVLARSPSPREVTRLASFLAKERQRFQTAPDQADELLGIGLYHSKNKIPEPEKAAWTSVSRAVLNLHESITRY
ncbi:PSD1 and planctomycete cytochrome C domain-containing protein [Luteolibacter algae]|uniref:PSD1 and planctomycete cytochrome C domain-containing protein n=1 Tax=Luteolibacter algae TaxID=454151 RepID=A0ABW5D5V0_9BACT